MLPRTLCVQKGLLKFFRRGTWNSFDLLSPWSGLSTPQTVTKQKAWEGLRRGVFWCKGDIRVPHSSQSCVQSGGPWP